MKTDIKKNKNIAFHSFIFHHKHKRRSNKTCTFYVHVTYTVHYTVIRYSIHTTYFLIYLTFTFFCCCAVYVNKGRSVGLSVFY
jgi:hypothetical protein